ncbi:uncharacterized protein LOC122668581 [Telopea speciosissima]|uniref:uncharacterized protein LOC122668581 n=1 Tax=Telopea speciosissima TaxID=54955 RepID=UPI001CC3AAFF|nr:uncharacterized protein LOC122668581 [Telopea speciosissima]
MALEAKIKLMFLDGTLAKPDPSSTDSTNWVRCNSMVRSWIVHSTAPSIAHSILWIDSATDIWKDLHERFSQKNAPRIFEIRKTISNQVQGTDSIAAYFTKIKGFRDELLSYRTLPSCYCGANTSLQTFLTEDYLMDFLQGLNESYAAIRSQLLLMDPLPFVNKAYSLLLQEERQRSIHDAILPTLAAMATTHFPSSSKPIYHCSHCGKDGHSDSCCFKKHGYPDWWKDRTGSKRFSQANVAKPVRLPSLVAAITTDSNTDSAPTLTAAQLQQLLSLIPSGNHPLVNMAEPENEEDFSDG